MASGISTAFAERARPVLNLIDDLRKIGVQQCVPIPQIAVMGDQSSGKSSVLEAISGIAFPRSAGLCTRCPTQVSMTHGDVWSASIRAGSGKEHKLKAGEEHLIADLIEELTTELAGSKSDGGFSSNDDQIEISLVSPNVPDLTVIDLPGIVRTTTKGQSQEVKNQVDNMLDRFLQQERTIVLAVIPANVDIATVDILERAAKVDPHGKRTIGVLTKPDLVDNGAEAQVVDVLANRTKPLLHGYFMVKNRSQKELDSAETQKAARRSESAWLARSKYANIPGVSESRLGVKALTSALTELLVDRIVHVLPVMTKEVEQNLKAANAELASLGSPPPTSSAHCRALAGNLLREFFRDLRRTSAESGPIIQGSAHESEGVLQQERKLRKAFITAVEDTKPGFDGEEDKFTGEVMEVRENAALDSGVTKKKVGQVSNISWKIPQSITNAGDECSTQYALHGYTKCRVIALTSYFRGDLAKRMEERRGRELPGFMSFPVFRDLIAEYVGRWEEPTMAFQDAVCDVLSQGALTLASSVAEYWPRFAEKMKDELQIHFCETKSCTSRRIAKQLALEKIPSTENHYLWDTINRIRDDRMEAIVRKKASYGQQISIETVCALLKSDIGNSSNESQEVQDMIDMLKAYWKLAKKRYIDEVGMIVTDSYTSPRHMDVIEKRLSSALVLNLDDSSLKRFFEPNRMKEKRREQLKKQAKSMKQARVRLREGI